MGYSYGVGWDGIKEGFWGYLDAIGQTTGVEMIENIGEQGVMRARSQLAQIVTGKHHRNSPFHLISL